MKPDRPWLDRPWLLLALVLVLLGFADVLLLGRTFVGFDHAIEYFPTWVFIRDSLLHGELPLWDPRANAGTPCLAAVYGGALDPVRWAFFPLPATLGYTLHVVALHLLAAAGAFRLARALGARPWIAAVAAVLLGSGGPLRSLGGFEKELAASAWVPWALLVAVSFGRAPRPATALLGGALVALMVLAGGPEWAIATGALLLATALWRASLDLRGPAREGARPGVRALGPVALVLLAGGVALALSLGVVLPARELAQISTRHGGVPPDQRLAHATHPLELATLVLPGIFGSSAREWRTLGMALFGQSYFLPVLYPGLLALLLAPLAPWRTSRATRGLGLVALLAVWCALGERAGLLRGIMEAFPPLQQFRYAYKAWAFAAPALAVLGALGLERVAREGLSRRARAALRALALLGIVVAIAALAALVFPELRDRVQARFVPGEVPEVARITQDELREAAIALLVRGLALAFFATALASAAARPAAPTTTGRERALQAVALLALVELTLTTRAATPTISQSFYEKPPLLAGFFTPGPGEPPPRFYPETRTDPIPRVFERSYGERYWEWDKARLRANLATTWSLAQLHDYNPGKLAWWNAAEARIESEGPLERTRLLAWFGVELVVSRSLLANPWLVEVGRDPFGPAILYRNRAAAPRYEVRRDVERLARHADALARANPANPAILVRADGADLEPEDWELPDASRLRGASLSLTPEESAVLGDPPARGPATVAVVLDEPRRVELELREPARDGDWLLARDTWEPRWTATVDGAPAQVQRADFCFRAVRLPPGARRVVFEYDGSLARTAFALQSLAWAVVALALVLLRRRSR